MEIIALITGNINTIFGVLFAIHGLAVTIVNLTPTPSDDVWVGKAYKVLEFLAGVFGYTAKELPGERAIDATFGNTFSVVDDLDWSDWLSD